MVTVERRGSSAETGKYDFVGVGPLVELCILTVDSFPQPGGGAPVLEEEVLLGSDAPIVYASLRQAGLHARLVCNAVNPHRNPALCEWARTNCVEGLVYDPDSPLARTYAISTKEARQRTWFSPNGIRPRDIKAQIDVLTRYLYIDWYPEVRDWIEPGLLLDARQNTRLCINLATHSDEAALDLAARCSPHLLQVSTRMPIHETVAYARELRSRTAAETVVATMGPNGSVLVSSELDQPDVVQQRGTGPSRTGSGAVFTGAILTARIDGQGWQESHRRANSLSFAFAHRAKHDAFPALNLGWPSATIEGAAPIAGKARPTFEPKEIERAPWTEGASPYSPQQTRSSPT